MDKCIDCRGKDYLQNIFKELSKTFGCENTCEAVAKYRDILDRLNLPKIEIKSEDFEVLVSSINITRLKNHPINLDKNSINTLYHLI